MREIDIKRVEETVAELCITANHHLGADLKGCIGNSLAEESWPVAREVLQSIQENIGIAAEGVFLYARIQEWLVYF